MKKIVHGPSINENKNEHKARARERLTMRAIEKKAKNNIVR